MLAQQGFGGKKRHQLLHDVLRLQHAAVSGFAAGLISSAHVQHVHTIGLKLRHIALGGGVHPHFAVHSRGHQERHLIHRPGQTHQAQQVIRATMQQFGHKVCAARRHQNGVGFAAQVDVGHVVGSAVVPLRTKHLPVRQGLHRDFGDELLCRLGHHHLHRSTLFNQGAAQFGRLVASNASGEPQNDVFTSQVTHGRECSRGGTYN